jgi:threonine dehydratase
MLIVNSKEDAMLSLAQIREAATVLQSKFRRTELIHSPFFSQLIGTPVYFKCENLQRSGSFKVRGACNFMSRQSASRLAAGVVTASAGNHAQGVALSASRMGVTATVVMPENTPLVKVQATRGYGARVLLRGAVFDEALEEALRLAKSQGLLYVPAFDDLLIMAGQGTVGLEIVEDLPDVDTVLVPVGGGGLVAGVATAIKALRPAAQIIGVEAEMAAAALASRRQGRIVRLPGAHSLADGIALKCIGEQTFPIIESLVDELVTVSEEEIAQAIVELMEKTHLVVEGAGAVGVAALLHAARPLVRGHTVCLLSGGNIDVQTIAKVVDRGLVAAGRYLKLRVELNDAPGALGRLALLLGQCRANIYRVSHDRHHIDVPMGRAEVHLELETRGPEHVREILAALEKAAYRVVGVDS